ncbi:hypothetical protein RM844_23205 [Streptomyces sp. DSM 44915]|uniref:DUF559 domain-containing protein n=1 Tax=Streptomyces chisholmiae TaxID=3075540 RepID=A0ABU2JYC0_9ACTN|nr:hypothetical protein [Streptomyces sp. DSM 44915]MDT0269198.1 hypothetical protein [Streptomyces sp. DSM 44915]
MTHDVPLTPGQRPELAPVNGRVTTLDALRAQGVPPATTRRRCRPGGPWQMPLPGVVLLHPDPPDGAELSHAVLRYTGGGRGEAVISGLAALAAHGLTSVPRLADLRRIDVLVPHTRRLRSVGPARVLRTTRLPRPRRVAGLPVAPVARALADALLDPADGLAPPYRPLAEAVRLGLAEPRSVVAELTHTGRLAEPPLARAVEELLAAGRPVAEELLIHMVRRGGLPDPCWNVALWLPDGPFLDHVDAYWPEAAVALRLDTGLPRQRGTPPTPAEAESERREQTLRGLGVTVVRIPPRALHASWRRQATAVRAALQAAATRPTTDWVVVLPR